MVSLISLAAPEDVAVAMLFESLLRHVPASRFLGLWICSESPTNARRITDESRSLLEDIKMLSLTNKKPEPSHQT